MHPFTTTDPAIYGVRPTYGRPYRAARPAYRPPSRPAGTGVTVDDLVTDRRLPRRRIDPALASLADRRQTAWMGLDDLIPQARARADLYRQHLIELDYEEIAIRNASRRCPRPIGWEPHEDPEVLRDLQAIDDQRRRERVDFWRDMSRIRLMMPESASAYLGASRRLDLLGEGYQP